MNDTMQLPVPLTEEELLIKGGELSALWAELEDAENRKKSVAAAMKGEIDTLTSRISGLARIVRDKAEDRPVEVTERKNFDRLTMETIRLDTGKVVSSRPLRGEERNLDLFAGVEPVASPEAVAEADGKTLVEFPAPDNAVQ